MKFWFANLLRILRSWPAVIIGLIIAGLFAAMIAHFSDRALIAGNYGAYYAQINLVLDIFSVIGIALFVASVVYKLLTFRTLRDTNQTGRFGGFFSALVAGCGSCSLTIASYLGLASLLTFLPRGGLELKIIGVIVLLRSVWKNTKDLMVCKIKL